MVAVCTRVYKATLGSTVGKLVISDDADDDDISWHRHAYSSYLGDFWMVWYGRYLTWDRWAKGLPACHFAPA